MNSNIKIMKTLMKIPTTLDEDMESLLLLLSITAQSDALPGQLQQQPCKKSKLARSGNGTTSTAIMDIFLVSQDSIHLEGQWKSSLQICGICGMQWTRCTSLHWRQRRGRQSIVKINRKKLRAKQLPHASDSPFCQFAQITQLPWVPSTNKHVVKKAENRQSWTRRKATRLVADLFPAQKWIGYDNKTAVKIMDDDNREGLCFFHSHSHDKYMQSRHYPRTWHKEYSSFCTSWCHSFWQDDQASRPGLQNDMSRIQHGR
jgi:hypothetical protein